MKKLFIALMCMLLVACSSKPAGYSKEGWEIAQEVIEIGEAYVDDKIDADSAGKRLDRLKDKADVLTDKKNHYRDDALSTDIQALKDLMTYSFGTKYDVEKWIKIIKGE